MELEIYKLTRRLRPVPSRRLGVDFRAHHTVSEGPLLPKVVLAIYLLKESVNIVVSG